MSDSPCDLTTKKDIVTATREVLQQICLRVDESSGLTVDDVLAALSTGLILMQAQVYSQLGEAAQVPAGMKPQAILEMAATSTQQLGDDMARLAKFVAAAEEAFARETAASELVS